MRILIATFTYLPNRDGVAAACRMMAEGLHDRGHVVTVVTASAAGRTGNPARIGGMEVHSFEAESEDAALRAAEQARFRQWVNAWEGDLIITHCWETWTTEILRELRRKRRLRPRLILISHGYESHQILWGPHFAWGLGAWVKRWPKVAALPRRMRDFDWVTFLGSRGDLGRFFDLRVARLTFFKRRSVIPNGIDPGRLEGRAGGFRASFAIEESVLFLTVANFCDRKNQKLAVRAFYRAALPNSVLVLIGSELGSYGEETQTVEWKLRSTAPGARVIFLERVEQEMIASAYRSCTAFLLTSKAETQPIVLLEAMAAGKPWISTPTGCVAELPGGVVATGKAGLAAAMEMLAHDAEARERLGAEGQRAVEKTYHRQAYVSAYEALCLRLGMGKRHPVTVPEKPARAG